MFGPPKLVSENRLCGPYSIERSSERENLESSSYEKTATKSAINCQSKASLQFSAIESKHNHFNFSAPQFPGTTCMQPWFLCPPWHDVPLYIHTIVEYCFQPHYWFQVNIVVVRFIMNVCNWTVCNLMVCNLTMCNLTVCNLTVCNLTVCNLLDIMRKIRIWVRIYDPFVSNLGIDECLNQ